MRTWLTLTASDGHSVGAYRSDPKGAPLGGIVVIQEIFGVNHHIRSVCDRFAAAGYAAVAPALFDRIARNFESGYSPPEVEAARKFIADIDWKALIRDTEAAVEAVRPAGRVSVVGFCMGGSVAFLAATQIERLSAAVCFYGGQIIRYADRKPKCPTQMHFGEKDDHIPMTDVAAIRSRRPECDIHVYPAGHGFFCDERASYHQPSAMLAWDRALNWIKRAAEPGALAKMMPVKAAPATHEVEGVGARSASRKKKPVGAKPAAGKNKPPVRRKQSKARSES